jgi:hypothetical protein
VSTEKSRYPESDACLETESRRRLVARDRAAAAGATLVVVALLLAGAVSAALAMG